MEKVVNIIGTGVSARKLPDTGENWGINYAYAYGPMEKLFFMDGIDALIADKERALAKFGSTLWDAVKENPKMQLFSKTEVLMPLKGLDGKPFIVNNEPIFIQPFPLADALNLIPGGYFTSTMAYVIAYAILSEVDRIRLYGFEVWSGHDANEFQTQRPCIDFWLAYALGKGIQVECPWYLIHTIGNEQNLYGFTNPSEVKGRF